MFNHALKVDGPLALRRLFYGRRGEPYSIGGHTLRFEPISRPVRLKYADIPPNTDDVSRYDALQLRFLVDHVKPGWRALDVGANHGQDSLILAALTGPTGQVTAFEPNPDAAQVFQRNVRLNGRLKPPELVEAAVSDTDGTAVLICDGDTANSSLASTSTGGAGELQVRTVRLDNYADPAPHLVKVDVEGFEVHVLRGAPRILASDAVILCELHPYAWPALGESLESLKALVRPYGRRLRYLDQSGEVTAAKYGICLIERV